MSNVASTHVCLVIDRVFGDHIGKQALVILINRHLFVLSPKSVRKNSMYYDSGFSVYIKPNRTVEISIGIITPTKKDKGYFHTYVKHEIDPIGRPIAQDIVFVSPGNVYQITAQLYIAESYTSRPTK